MRKVLAFLIFLCASLSALTQTTYTFIGNGSWKNPTNWVNNTIPPTTLEAGSKIVIDPLAAGICTLDTIQFILDGATINVQPNKNFVITGDLDNAPQIHGTGCIPADSTLLSLVPELDTNLLKPVNGRKIGSSFQLKMPAKSDLPPILSQGSQGSCTAFSTAYATRSFYLQQDHCTNYNKNGNVDYTKVLSPTFSYILGRKNWDCNNGFSILTALRDMQNIGVCTWKEMPYELNDCVKLPSDEAYKNAEIYKIKGILKITNITEAFIKRILNSGHPIMAGVYLDYGFWKKGNYIWRSPLGKTIGGHAIVIYGYDDSLHAYKIMNSYGNGWGFNGYGLIDYDYLSKVMMRTTAIVDNKADFNMFVMRTAPHFSIDFEIPQLTAINTPIKFENLTEPEPNAVKWSFPGGSPSTSSELSPVTTYKDPGSYTVTLTTSTCNGYTQTRDSVIVVSNSFVDPRDGQRYTYKTIGSQTWMTQNLNFATPAGSWCYENDPANCGKYGRLYDWETALTVAPPGWHLPTDEEWITLVTHLGGVAQAGGAMKSVTGWNAPNVGATNSSGFTGLPSGNFISRLNKFSDLGTWGDWWSANSDDPEGAHEWNLNNEEAEIGRDQFERTDGLAVRCIKDK